MDGIETSKLPTRAIMKVTGNEMGRTQLMVAKTSLPGGDRGQTSKWFNRWPRQADPPSPQLHFPGHTVFPHHLCPDLVTPLLSTPQWLPITESQVQARGNLWRTRPWLPLRPRLLLPLLLLTLAQGLYVVKFIPILGPLPWLFPLPPMLS